jgi:hypothetical protein
MAPSSSRGPDEAHNPWEFRAERRDARNRAYSSIVAALGNEKSANPLTLNEPVHSFPTLLADLATIDAGRHHRQVADRWDETSAVARTEGVPRCGPGGSPLVI